MHECSFQPAFPKIGQIKDDGARDVFAAGSLLLEEFGWYVLMASLGDRMGQWDDEASGLNGSATKALITAVVVTVVTIVIFIALEAWLGRPGALIVSAVLVVAWGIVYVTWRRRRNKRLTGSPTKWPS